MTTKFGLLQFRGSPGDVIRGNNSFLVHSTFNAISEQKGIESVSDKGDARDMDEKLTVCSPSKRLAGGGWLAMSASSSI